MKRLSLVLFTLLSFSAAKTQSHFQTGRCYIFKGRIDQYPITLIFEEFGNDIQGRYYYNKIGTIIDLKGSLNDSGYTFQTLYTNEKETETFGLRVFHDELFGKWTKNGKTLPITLWRNTNPIDIIRFQKKLEAKTILANAKIPHNPEDWYQTASISFTILWPNSADDNESAIRENQFNWINSIELGAEAASTIKFAEPISVQTQRGNPEQLKQIIERICDTAFAGYKRDIIAAAKNNESIYASNFSLDIDNRYIYDSENFQVTETVQSEYTGGAHGLYFRDHLTWHKTKNKIVEISDFLTTQQQSTIPKAMTVNFKIAHQIPQKDPLNQHGYWIDSFEGLGGDTYFTDLGIHTSFGLYEIAPYSEGLVEVFVPWKEVK